MLLAAFATASNGVVVWLTAEVMHGTAALPRPGVSRPSPPDRMVPIRVGLGHLLYA